MEGLVLLFRLSGDVGVGVGVGVGGGGGLDDEWMAGDWISDDRTCSPVTRNQTSKQIGKACWRLHERVIRVIVFPVFVCEL